MAKLAFSMQGPCLSLPMRRPLDILIKEAGKKL